MAFCNIQTAKTSERKQSEKKEQVPPQSDNVLHFLT
jgi:hypothetical protein